MFRPTDLSWLTSHTNGVINNYRHLRPTRTHTQLIKLGYADVHATAALSNTPMCLRRLGFTHYSALLSFDAFPSTELGCLEYPDKPYIIRNCRKLHFPAKSMGPCHSKKNCGGFENTWIPQRVPNSRSKSYKVDRNLHAKN